MLNKKNNNCIVLILLQYNFKNSIVPTAVYTQEKKKSEKNPQKLLGVVKSNKFTVITFKFVFVY